MTAPAGSPEARLNALGDFVEREFGHCSDSARPFEQTLYKGIDELKRNAERYLWLRQHLGIGSDGPNEWTCWLNLVCIPYRLAPGIADPQILLDALIARFPLQRKKDE